MLLGGNDGITCEVSRLVSQLPPAVQALTGVDVSKVIIATMESSNFSPYFRNDLIFILKMFLNLNHFDSIFQEALILLKRFSMNLLMPLFIESLFNLIFPRDVII